jgi:hypothetical protein
MQATLMNRQTFRKNIGFAPAARSAAAAAVLAAGMASAPAASNSPLIYSISPSSGSPINPNISPLSSGTKIIITGKNFTPESAIHFCGGYINSGLELVSSPSGPDQTITFVLFEILAGAMCPSKYPCPTFAYRVPFGRCDVSVVNAHGTSNTVTFTVTKENQR